MKHFINLIFIILFCTSCYTKKTIKKESNTKEKNKISTSPKTNIPKVEKDKTIIDPIFNDVQVNDTLVNDAQANDIQINNIQQVSTEAFNHNHWNKLLQKHVSKEGNVNYKGFKNDRLSLTAYIKSLGENMPTNRWSKEDKLAYWINAYNAMTVDLIIKKYPIKSIRNIFSPWKKRLWKLGKKWYNLNEIEHKILRKMNEPRIHFTIVCASYSCPKLSNKAYVAKDLELQLTKATKDFLSDPERNNLSENNIKLSKIFKWFSNDFKNDGTLIDFLNKYSDIKILNSAKKSFKKYNWDLNE